MKAKEWRRRINRAYQSAAAGNAEQLAELCEELEAMTEPKANPVPLPPVVVNAVPPAGETIET